MQTYHEIINHKKVRSLAESMRQNGWQGMPLVLIDDNGRLLTGSHRYPAAMAAGLSNDDIPTIELETIFSRAGLDMDEEMREINAEQPDISDHSLMLELTALLPDDVRDQYGIDLQ